MAKARACDVAELFEQERDLCKCVTASAGSRDLSKSALARNGPWH